MAFDHCLHVSASELFTVKRSQPEAPPLCVNGPELKLLNIPDCPGWELRVGVPTIVTPDPKRVDASIVGSSVRLTRNGADIKWEAAIAARASSLSGVRL